MRPRAGVGRRLLAALTAAHRWAGIFFAPVFLIWFASGVVLLFHQMPAFSEEEELAMAQPLTARIAVTPAQLVDAGYWTEGPADLTLRMLGTHPVYEVEGATGPMLVSADSGAVVPPVDAAAAAALARAHVGAAARRATTVETLDRPDQWTFSVPPSRLGPLHRVAFGDPDGTEVYVAARSGRVVMRTTRASRTWAWLGAIPHWWYVRALRAHPLVWASLVVYGALAGLLTALGGLVVGVSRFDRAGRYFAGQSRSPYRDWLRWHHWLGLSGGALACTWVLSGMLSMSPWDWSPGNGPDPAAVEAVRDAGTGDPRAFRLSPGEVVAAQPAGSVKRIRTTWALGQPFYRLEGPGRSTLMGADAQRPSAHPPFTSDELHRAALRALPGMPVAESTWLTRFDAYYYSAGAGAGDLPVLRVRFDDPEGTTLYLRAIDGALVQQETRVTRLERWLYHGLHSLDLPGLYQRQALWRTVVLLLLVPGLLLSASSIVIAWRRLRGMR